MSHLFWPEDVVKFYSEVCDLCEQAGYRGLAIFTDELQATVAEYRPSRDQFFNQLIPYCKRHPRAARQMGTDQQHG